MSARVCRSIVALAVAPWLVVASGVPQEHVHEADAAHPQSLAHRHAEPHAFDAHDHDGAKFDHGEDHVVWLSNASVSQGTFRFDVAWAVVGNPFETVSDIASWFATAAYDASPPHGPPRPSSYPRAPPLASRLI